MTEAHAEKPSHVLPFRDPSRRRRLVKTGSWLGGVALAIFILGLLGIDVRGWLRDLWDSLTGIGLEYLVAGFALQTVQTTMTALGWYFVLWAGFRKAPLSYLQVLAAYATGVALNGFLPANLGTFVMLLMFVAMIPGATLPGVLGSMVVQKIFFTVAGTFVYVYLFLSVPGSFELQLGGPHDHPVLAVVIVVGGGFLLVLLGRPLGEGERGRRHPRPPARVRGQGRAAVLRCLARQARRDGRLPRRVRDPGDLSHGHVGHRRQLAREHGVRDPRAASA